MNQRKRRNTNFKTYTQDTSTKRIKLIVYKSADKGKAGVQEYSWIFFVDEYFVQYE